MGKGVDAYVAAKAALLEKVLPLYNQVKDEQQKQRFVGAMLAPRGPRVLPDGGAGLQILDFPGMTNEIYGRYAQAGYDDGTTTGGIPLGPDAMSKEALDALIQQAMSFGAVKPKPAPQHPK